jgi:cation diffusion facilitator CzcD-associated flavoprotein CzcO
MVGNVLPEYLSFSSHKQFPTPATAPDQPFPSLKETHEYLTDFAEPFLSDGRIRCNVEALRVEETLEGKWEVTVRDTKEQSGMSVNETWDAVAISTGWHSSPFWPPTEGLDLLRNLGLAMHAKDWMGVDFHGLRGKVSSSLLCPASKS